MKVIIAHKYALDMDKVHVGPCTDVNGDFHEVAFRIVRQATLDEYLAFCQEQNANMLYALQTAEKSQVFYEILMD